MHWNKLRHKECADCQSTNISSLWENIDNKWRSCWYYFYCVDCKSDNIFNKTWMRQPLIFNYKNMYKLTPNTLESLKSLRLEWKNWIRVFDSSPKGFVIWLWMPKNEAIEKGIIEKKKPNPLRELIKNNFYIPHEWIKKNLSYEDYTKFNDLMVWQAQSEYGVFQWDIQRFLNHNQL